MSRSARPEKAPASTACRCSDGLATCDGGAAAPGPSRIDHRSVRSWPGLPALVRALARVRCAGFASVGLTRTTALLPGQSLHQSDDEPHQPKDPHTITTTSLGGARAAPGYSRARRATRAFPLALLAAELDRGRGGGGTGR